MNSNVFSKRIPTALGLLLLVGGLITGILLVGQRQGLGTKAGPTSQPKEVKISNRASGGYTVSWITDVPVTGFIKYSDNPSNLTLPAGDIRDQIAGSTSQYVVHYVDITGLSPDKTYYFEIGSGTQTYNDAGKPYQVRTAPEITAPTEDVVSGKIVTATGANVSGAVVYVEINNAEPLATLSKTDGTWRLALSNARNKNGDFVAYSKTDETVTIFVQAGTAGTATAMTNTAMANPVPEITLGKTHNFTTGEVALITDASSESQSTLVKMLNPAVEGESLATQTPEFLGTGPAGIEISLTLDTVGQTGTTTASTTGSWSWSPSTELALGGHTIEVRFQEDGVTQKFSRGFIILETGTGGLPAFTSTDSATPIITATLTPSENPTPTEVTTPTPTVAEEPTTTPTVASASATPTATVSGEMPSTEGGLPASGVLTPTLIILILGIGLFLSGIVWKRKILETA